MLILLKTFLWHFVIIEFKYTNKYMGQSSPISSCLPMWISLTTDKRSRESIRTLWTYNMNKLLRCWCVILLLEKVLIRQREENDISAVAFVTEKVRYTWSSLSTSLSVPPLTIFLWLSYISDGPHTCHLLHMNSRACIGSVDGIWQYKQLYPQAAKTRKYLVTASRISCIV